MAVEYVKPMVFIAYVKARGYRVEPLTGATEATSGRYVLFGPRHNRKTVSENAEGLLSLTDATSWCDGMDSKIARLRRHS